MRKQSRNIFGFLKNHIGSIRKFPIAGILTVILFFGFSPSSVMGADPCENLAISGFISVINPSDGQTFTTAADRTGITFKLKSITAPAGGRSVNVEFVIDGSGTGLVNIGTGTREYSEVNTILLGSHSVQALQRVDDIGRTTIVCSSKFQFSVVRAPAVSISSTTPAENSSSPSSNVTLSATAASPFVAAGEKLHLDLFSDNISVKSADAATTPLTLQLPIVLSNGTHTVRADAKLINTQTNEVLAQASQENHFTVQAPKALGISSLTPEGGATFSSSNVTLSATSASIGGPVEGEKLHLDLFLDNINVKSADAATTPLTLQLPVVLSNGTHTVRADAKLINTQTNEVLAQASQESRFEMALPSAPAKKIPLVYAGRRDQGIIDVIDAGTNRIVDTIQVSQLGGLRLAATPDGNRIYVIGFGGGNEKVSIVDVTANLEIGTIGLPGQATGLSITPDGGRVFVSVPNGTIGSHDAVLVIDTAINTVIGSIDVGDKVFPSSIAFSPSGKQAYIATDRTNNVLVLDTISNTVAETLAVGGGEHHLAVTPDGRHVYVVNRDSNNVSVIDTAANQVISTIPVGNLPEGVAITPDGRRAYVASFVSAFNGRLEVIDTVTNQVTGTVSLNGRNGPEEVGITPDGTRAYVTHGADQVVSVISIATNQVVQTIDTGVPTVGVAMSPLPIFGRKLGDINRDEFINRNDLSILSSDLRKAVDQSACGLRCDLDGDGIITVLDARKLVLLCTRPQCATQ